MPRPSPFLRLFATLLPGAVLAPCGWTQPAAPVVDFAREIQPILAGKCYDCHGAEKPKGGLRLTSRASALRGGESGEPAFVAGASARSQLIQRITTTDENDVMPQKGAPLSPAEVALVRRWIDEGAHWPDDLRHWAYVKPVRPAVPPVPDRSRVRNPIDAFVLARLEQAGLKASPPADKPRWLRRVSLDLIGLPPTPADVDAFIADTSDGAHERVVDRLLASPHYGERWARPWLDLARYADSHGFQRDDLRDLWPYRDWVVRAMNADLPFDQFTVWQIAGDLLPEVRDAAGRPRNLDPLIATGFHRAAPTNVEAGTDQEEGRVNQVFDRVNTTAAVWLGTTLECAQCHSHKYDPFSQQDYYRLFAYFNHTPRETDFTTPKAMAALKFTGPYLELPDPANDAARGRLEVRRKELDAQIAARSAEVLAGASTPEAKAPTGKQRTQLLAGDKALAELRTQRQALMRELEALKPPQTLVMRELDEPRPTAVLSRGNFLEPGEPVQPGTPAALHAAPPPAGPRATRLDLARWLVDRENPLVARVTVNRWWAEFFGRGIVGTLEDFGLKGDAPTHPELLDWLAVEFMERGWSMKHVHRLIVLSATYGQSSRLTPELLAADDQNKWLARGPRFRLDAETIRDNALALAGLLSLKQGGPPVRPYQPPGLWENKVGGDRVTYEVSPGEDAWRRGLYTVWKRSSPYPSFMNFDATARTACTVRRSRSNTPLQALTLLNDPVYVAAARGLAHRVLTERPAAGTAERLRHAFRLCLAREPSAVELAALAGLLAQQADAAAADPGAAARVSGARPPPPGSSVAELAAWHAVATALLNLDETITKG
ncbi:MAG: PSD1 domain-containing protein [Opitutaceae bacterium]|nr:PSD1 domain-containing protein [Opitutaceae bacterium]